MKVKQRLRSLVESGLAVAFRRFGPHGLDVFSDMRRLGVRFEPRLILDVGANIGEFADATARRFPSTNILAFEPSQTNILRLRERFRDKVLLETVQCALSSASGSLHFIDDPSDHTMARLTTPDEEGAYRVPVETVDQICADRHFEGVDYLKVDTEGHDLEVLRGAEHMLRNQRVTFVEVEAGMNRDNTYHVPLEAMKEHMEDRGYRLFGLYEQMHEWPTKQVNLRRCNAVFISPQAVGTSERLPCVSQ